MRAINQMAKAQILLGKEEQKEHFVRALVGTALAYEKAGLLWAARANFVFALDRTMADFNSGGAIDVIAIRLVRKLIWLELQLGRIPCVFAWIELLRLFSNAVEVDDEKKKQFEEDDRLIDVVLGILLLRSPFTDLPRVGSSVGLLERLSLIMSSTALLFALGHEDTLRAELGESMENLEEFVKKWASQPAAKDLPLEAQWHLGGSSQHEDGSSRLPIRIRGRKSNGFDCVRRGCTWVLGVVLFHRPQIAWTVRDARTAHYRSSSD